MKTNDENGKLSRLYFLLQKSINLYGTTLKNFCMDLFEEHIRKIVKKHVKADVALQTPPNPEFGDYAVACFPFAKTLKKDPKQIAEELAKKFKPDHLIKKATANGPYLNFFVNKGHWSQSIIQRILKEKDKYGSMQLGKGKKALIEHTSINPNASPHVGRARNAILGDAIARLLKFQGYKLETHFFVNDVGKQIAMLVLGCEGKKKVTFDELLGIYVSISKKIEKHPDMEQKVFALLNKLDKKDRETMQKFRSVVKTCIDGQTAILNELGIHYDYFDYESDYLWSRETEKILDRLRDTGKLFEDEEKRLVLDQQEFNLAMKSPVLVLTRADKTSLYPLRDMAYTIDKLKKGVHENILVLGEDQKLYFQQLAAALSILNYKAPRAVHYSFVLLQEGKMSTRQGNLVLLKDFMEEAVQKAEKEVRKRNPKQNPKKIKEIADSIGHGAIKYSILKVSPEKNVNFDWEQALSFEGDSGPYLQYAYARIQSIFSKHGKKLEHNADFSLLEHPQEQSLVKKLSQFPEIVKSASNSLRPHLIAVYTYQLAQQFSEFYHSCPILKEKEALKRARLLLAYAVAQVLGTSLWLLGIDAVESM